ncbi:hypothetical protein [Dechloromonas sp. HYN0024]|uniref:hypothetical protein n=1 Tax=Dechloromonas sp. HYN0024 TaxID=2231055 RepID=UPI000E43EB5C|nr:hypothetical protein [Dechloromonas sp. HYN0024]AXS80784.1 hypothetical protein HYN24_12600 [Dechloromonas sp. HYN0024]
MHEQIIHLHREAPAKPAEGQPCNGCGVCCALETCPAARLRFRQGQGLCPALHWSTDDRRYHCGLLVDPKKYLPWLPGLATSAAKRLLARWIAAGQGCDCDAEVQA